MSVDLSTGPGKMMNIVKLMKNLSVFVFAFRPGGLRLWPRPGCWCVQLAGPHRAIEESRCLRKISRVARRYVALTESASLSSLRMSKIVE